MKCVKRLICLLFAGVMSLTTLSSHAATISSNYQQTILSQTPMAYWRLGETSGVTAVDESGNGNDATYTASPTLGSAGPQNPPFNGFEAANLSPAFDGVSDHRITTTLTGLGLDYSASLWVKNDRAINVQPITGYALTRSDTVGTGAQSTSDHVGINGTNASTGSPGDMFMHNGSAAIDGTTFITDNTWHHFAFTRSGNTVSLYLDGNLEVSNTLTRTFTSTNAQITIGTRGDNFSDWLGNLDEVAVFNRVLTPAEITAQFQAGFTGLPIPEPSSFVLLGCGLSLFRRKRGQTKELA